MRDPERIQPFIDKLMELWKENPDFRFGQLVMGIAMTGEHNPKLFNMEDDVFLTQISARKNQIVKHKH